MCPDLNLPPIIFPLKLIPPPASLYRWEHGQFPNIQSCNIRTIFVVFSLNSCWVTWHLSQILCIYPFPTHSHPTHFVRLLWFYFFTQLLQYLPSPLPTLSSPRTHSIICQINPLRSHSNYIMPSSQTLNDSPWSHQISFKFLTLIRVRTFCGRGPNLSFQTYHLIQIVLPSLRFLFGPAFWSSFPLSPVCTNFQILSTLWAHLKYSPKSRACGAQLDESRANCFKAGATLAQICRVYSLGNLRMGFPLWRSLWMS